MLVLIKVYSVSFLVILFSIATPVSAESHSIREIVYHLRTAAGNMNI